MVILVNKHFRIKVKRTIVEYVFFVLGGSSIFHHLNWLMKWLKERDMLISGLKKKKKETWETPYCAAIYL